ncbi:MAG: hypothetical protein KHY61_07340, partial [Sutterella wadsworthensis]|nr:hypothetical protein [Sutterella wadsworthensis]
NPASLCENIPLIVMQLQGVLLPDFWKFTNLCVWSGFSGCSHKNWHLLRPSSSASTIQTLDDLTF